MAYGGIYDHVGGGFHRYSVDQRWRIPHFEKMLYDNAQLIPLYIEAAQLARATADAEELPAKAAQWRRQGTLFEQVARESSEYLLIELQREGGGFASATDADSLGPEGERVEGHFFTWSEAELRAALGASGLQRFRVAYGVTARGNFEGRSHLHLPRHLSLSAERLGVSLATLETTLRGDRARLYTLRQRRPAPLLDDKRIAAWNGLAIRGLAVAAFALKEPRYHEAAARAARFILAELRDEAGHLRRSWRGRPSENEGYLIDYSAMIRGLLSLYEGDGNRLWVEAARALQGILDADYRSREGDYFRSSRRHERLLLRERPNHDGALPSGNSLTALNLLHLYQLTSEAAYLQHADQLLRAAAPRLQRAPTSSPALLAALEMRLDQPWQIVLLRPAGAPQEAAESLRAVLRRSYLPNRVILDLDEASARRQQRMLPLLEEKLPRDGRATLYLCTEGSCLAPLQLPDELTTQLAMVAPLFEYQSPSPLPQRAPVDPYK